MKLLFDENLSRKLSSKLAELYPGSKHAYDAGLLQSPDAAWLRRWCHPTRDAEDLLRREAVRITEFAADPDLGLLILDKT